MGFVPPPPFSTAFPTLQIMSDTYDSPWKEILELYFFEFLDFFFPSRDSHPH